MTIERTRRMLMAPLCLLMLGCDSEVSRRVADLRSNDPQIRLKAAQTLADPRFAKNEQVVVALTAAISDDDPLVQKAAIISLGHFSDGASSAMPELEKSLSAEEPSIRLAAAQAIARIDPGSSRYQKPLLESLREGNGPLYLEIGKMGKNGHWATATLIDLLNHPKTHVRALAARTLGDIGLADDEITSALQRRLKDAEPSVRRAAEVALQKLR